MGATNESLTRSWIGMQKDCLERLVGRELVRQELQACAGGCCNLHHPWLAGGCQGVSPTAAVHQDCLSSDARTG